MREREIGGSLSRFAQARALPGAGFAEAERAVNVVVAAHPALRMRLRAEHGVWALRTEPARAVTLVRADTDDPAAAADEAADRLDPEAGQVIAFTWLDVTRTLVVTAHHIAIDAVSWLILLDDLATAMRGAALPPPTTSYAEYADALATASAHDIDGLGHWVHTLQAPAPLPTTGGRHEITVDLPPAGRGQRGGGLEG
ncbi:condensation domain-containing protein, partial [Spongiactinospora gelatinilytica]|uniref:condensation domain-containing protein n=1 Tax=Spongiactinospora gelatinilytica TaxID=2666298 RepID=UPI0018F3C73F